jgi:branched-subunit amino acid ABC-type transport system permease component
MSFEIAVLLAQDGIANGAIYALVALGLVIIFAVTRVIFVPFGDLAALAALTQAALQDRRFPGTVWLLLTLSVLTAATEAVRLLKLGDFRGARRSALAHLGVPMVPIAAAFLAAGRPLPVVAEIALTAGLVVPMGPLIYRCVFRPIAGGSVLLLLIVAVALHFSLSGMALIFFGPEGVRTKAIVEGGFELGGVPVTGQSILILCSTLLFGAILFWFFEYTLTGRALRATAINRVAARLVGIRPASAGSLAFTLSAALACVSGILIGPIATLYYDSGFLIGLKAFVGAIMGGLTNYPLSILGALFVGLLESYASFWNSGLKEVIVFSLLIPVLLVRSAISPAAGDDEDEGEETAFVSLRSMRKPVLVLLAAGLIAAPWFLGNYALTLLNFIGLSALVSLGLVLLTGIAGLTSFGQAAFVGLGAYATAWATTAQGMSPWIGGILALALAAGVAAALEPSRFVSEVTFCR